MKNVGRGNAKGKHEYNREKSVSAFRKTNLIIIRV
jgi:hypothetical protein